MKKLLLLLFSILISSPTRFVDSLFEKTICVETDAQKRYGVIYLPNKTKPFTGENLCKYENGQKSVEGKIKDGERNGKWTWWYESGEIEIEATFKDGKCISATEHAFLRDTKEDDGNCRIINSIFFRFNS